LYCSGVLLGARGGVAMEYLFHNPSLICDDKPIPEICGTVHLTQIISLYCHHWRCTGVKVHAKFVDADGDLKRQSWRGTRQHLGFARSYLAPQSRPRPYSNCHTTLLVERGCLGKQKTRCQRYLFSARRNASYSRWIFNETAATADIIFISRDIKPCLLEYFLRPHLRYPPLCRLWQGNVKWFHDSKAGAESYHACHRFLDTSVLMAWIDDLWSAPLLPLNRHHRLDAVCHSRWNFIIGTVVD